ncbi:MAG: hypothetical protein M3N18_09895 [Actinomycetota bacterium]|nr:hypothetical protein [Actinomycetota bacterium]
MRSRREIERDRAIRDEENKHRAETERRGAQLRAAWRQRHPMEDRDALGRPKKDRPA